MTTLELRTHLLRQAAPHCPRTLREKIHAALDRGRGESIGSRPRKVDPEKCRQMLGDGLTVAEIADRCGVSRQAVYQAVRVSGT
jgi:DNA invertase Pin-like site-specific DNA recombinase